MLCYCCTAKQLIFHIVFYCGLSQNIEYSSLCYSQKVRKTESNKVTWLSGFPLQVTASIPFIVFCWSTKTKAQSTQGAGAMLPLLPGKHGKVTWYKRMWKSSNAATTWKMQSAPLNVIITCFCLPDSHMYTENTQTPPMKPQLCEQDKYPEIFLEPSDAATCILIYSWNTLCELFIRESIFSYTLTAIFLSMLTASVHHRVMKVKTNANGLSYRQKWWDTF